MKRNRNSDEDEDAWLITYADMVTLLLCFFVILFAMSAPDMKKLEQFGKELRARGFYTDLVADEDPYATLKKNLDLSLGASGYDKAIAVTQTPDAVEVELGSSAFFQPGSARFTRDALPMLQLMASKILPLGKDNVLISVEGYTDDSPVHSEQYPSNWELSSARAANVVRYLIAQGFPQEQLRVVGFADTHPKAPNRDAVGTPIPANQDLNRRVVVRLTKGKNQ